MFKNVLDSCTTTQVFVFVFQILLQTNLHNKRCLFGFLLVYIQTAKPFGGLPLWRVTDHPKGGARRRCAAGQPKQNNCQMRCAHAINQQHTPACAQTYERGLLPLTLRLQGDTATISTPADIKQPTTPWHEHGHSTSTWLHNCT